MELPVCYFTMPDGSSLRATFVISGFSWVRIQIEEKRGRWLSSRWVVCNHVYSGKAERLMDFVGFPKERIHAWAKREVEEWHEYSKVLKAYRP